MAARDGRLDALTIGAIFVVVFALLYGGVMFSEGELLPAETTNETEDALRTAVWAELDDRRAARGVDPMPRNRFVRGIAQDTADDLAGEWRPTPTATAGDATLPNHRPYCTQLPVRVRVSNVSTLPTNETARRIADRLRATDDGGVLFRPPGRFRTAMGIAIEDGAVYAVYRSCEQADS